MKTKTLTCLTALAALAVATTPLAASARSHRTTGAVLTGLAVGLGIGMLSSASAHPVQTVYRYETTPVVIHQQAPVYYTQPVVYAPPPVYLPPPVYVHQPVYMPQPVYVNRPVYVSPCRPPVYHPPHRHHAVHQPWSSRPSTHRGTRAATHCDPPPSSHRGTHAAPPPPPPPRGGLRRR